MIVPRTGWQCRLTDLPARRLGHTQSGLTVCGGGTDLQTRSSCVRLEGRGWVTSHTLLYPRIHHTNWNSPLGLVLLGGAPVNAAELLHQNGTSSVLFYIQHDFR